MSNKQRFYWSIKTLPKSIFVRIVILSIIGMTLSCTSNSEAFRTRASKDYTIKYKNPTRMKVTGIGCALTIQEAQNISQKVAEYNLRTVAGHEELTFLFREVDRYVENGQHCVITEIESRAR